MSVKGMVVAMTLCMMVRKAEELTWKTETLFTTCCEGQNILLMWNYSTEKNETVEQSQWFFKKKTPICYYSESSGFQVSPLYTGRVELTGNSGILLKKVTSVDAGEYTLYPNLAVEQTKNTQTIFLTVYESPAYQCKPNITIHSSNVILCSTNSCGKPQLSHEWRIFEKRESVGNESYLIINSSWNAELVFCCLHGPNMKCHKGDPFEFCISTPISSKEDRTTAKNGHKVNTAPNYTDTENMGSVILVPAIICLVLFVTVIVLIVTFILWHWRKKKLRAMLCQNANMEQEHTIELQAVQSTPMMSDSGQVDNDLEFGQDQGLHEESPTQRIQMVNNFNIDSDFFKSMFDSQRDLRAEMQLSMKENKKLKRQLYHLEKKLQFQEREKLTAPSFELTMVPCEETSDNMSDDTSDYQDARSDAGTFTVHG